MNAVMIQDKIYTNGQTDGMKKYLITPNNVEIWALTKRDAIRKVKAGFSL